MGSRKLLIVESPAKAKTIAKYLGSEFTVKSSVGHVRDLPSENGAVKISAAGEGKWTFTPRYVVSKGKEKVVSELKDAVKKCDEIYLASDPDREGEAIAWHLREVLKATAGSKPFKRVTYNEITKGAVLKAVAEPREIDMPRVDAQQARRILDRLVGYRVSPLLWKYIPCANSKSLSAGRVQSVALRLLVERQREIDAFKPEKYFVLGVEAKKTQGSRQTFAARLARLDGVKCDIKSRQTADNLILDLSGAALAVTDFKRQPKARRPLPPFTTSTLQQAASSALGMSPGVTMKIAQALYEKGLVTYMRTDSVDVSEFARAAAKDFITGEFGAGYYPPRPNFYKSKAGAQGAHEAVRPTDVSATPAKCGLEGGGLKLYDLIWRRFVSSQMAEARTVLDTVCIEASKPGMEHSYLFTASATRVEFDGFLKVARLTASPGKPPEDGEDSDEVESLPPLAKGDALEAVRWLADEKETKGPARYSEASLVKALEENGVGRPSTYAATIETLKAREYAATEKRQIVPLERGTMVCDWLVKKLDGLFNVGYTAEMEAELDKVEEQGEPMDDMLSAFYSRFTKALDACKEPSPDAAKFDAVFALLDKIAVWKEPKTVGKRVYDDKAFVESVKKQRDQGKPLSARQLEFLVRMVALYSAQIPGADAALREAGVTPSARTDAPEKADPALVEYCFAAMDRIGGLGDNPFLKSLREQFDRGRGLSPRQFAVLARTVGEDASPLEDCDEIRAKLAPFVPGGFERGDNDPDAAKYLQLLAGVENWREPVKRAGRKYDDKAFYDSLVAQNERKKTLTFRQGAALKRLVATYRGEIPDLDAKAAALGVEIPSAERKGGGGGAGGAARRGFARKGALARRRKSS